MMSRMTLLAGKPVMTVEVRCMSGDSGGWLSNVFNRKAKKEEEAAKEKRLDDIHKQHEDLIAAAEREMAAARLQRKRNKSGLHHSDRQMLKGAPPNVGLKMQWAERHSTRQFKGEMLGKFGRSKTGVDPSVLWPTKEEIESQKEYERVFYDGTSLLERMDLHNRTETFRRQKMLDYEQEIDANLAQMDKEVTMWKKRVEKREADAAREKAMKDSIFAELRQEFGYDINPADPLFQDKIAEKEKAMNKKMKLTKRARKEEEEQARQAEEQKAKVAAAAKIKAAAAATATSQE